MDGTAKPPATPTAATPTAAKPLAAELAGVGEVEVLHHDRLAASPRGELDDRRDRGPQPPVADCRRQAVQVQRDGGQVADGVA